MTKYALSSEVRPSEAASVPDASTHRLIGEEFEHVGFPSDVHRCVFEQV